MLDIETSFNILLFYSGQNKRSSFLDKKELLEELKNLSVHFIASNNYRPLGNPRVFSGTESQLTFKVKRKVFARGLFSLSLNTDVEM